MSPRPYKTGPRRTAATEATRSKIVAAARELLADRGAMTFSIDAIAERADVARMTVYYQFKSKGKLLEAVFDDLAESANMRSMRNVFQESDPAKALEKMIGVFCNFWRTQGPLLRRLTVLAALDPEVERALVERRDWRRQALAVVVERIRGEAPADELIALLHALMSLETYDSLARRFDAKEIVDMLQRAAAVLVFADHWSRAAPEGR